MALSTDTDNTRLPEMAPSLILEWGRGARKFVKHTFFKQNACLVDTLGVFYVFSKFQVAMFFSTQKKVAKTMKKGPFGRPILRFGPPKNSPRPDSNPKSLLQRGQIPRFGGAKGSELADHPVHEKGDQMLRPPGRKGDEVISHNTCTNNEHGI